MLTCGSYDRGGLAESRRAMNKIKPQIRHAHEIGLHHARPLLFLN